MRHMLHAAIFVGFLIAAGATPALASPARMLLPLGEPVLQTSVTTNQPVTLALLSVGAVGLLRRRVKR
jgi:hypothetical protein